jgi:hypothetical protein
MVRNTILMLVVACSVSWPRPGHAAIADADALGPCDRAARAAELSHGLPGGILAAIGRVESGRSDAAGHVAPWPWTIDAAGADSYLPTAAAAVASVSERQRQGLRNIDVGCFQVNLRQHPDAFATLQAAFDPQTNADYAASFLTVLRQRTGSWDAAIAAYHSAQPELGIPYRDRVFAQWADAPAGLWVARPAGWEARLGRSVVIAGVRVWTPGAPGTAPMVIRIGLPAQVTPDSANPAP